MEKSLEDNLEIELIQLAHSNRDEENKKGFISYINKIAKLMKTSKTIEYFGELEKRMESAKLYLYNYYSEWVPNTFVKIPRRIKI